MSNEIGKSLRQRVEECEAEVLRLNGFVKAVMENLGKTMVNVATTLQQNANEINALNLLLEAVGNILGGTLLSDETDRLVRTKAEDRIARAVAEGKIVSADEAGPETVVVGRLYGKDGQPVRPGRFEWAFDQMDDLVRDSLKGAAVGRSIVIDDERFEVDAIYKAAPPAEAPAEVVDGQ